MSPALKACAASRLASSASAAELGICRAEAGGSRSDITPSDRSIAGSAGSTPSAYHPAPATEATRATCGQPPMRCVQDISTAGTSPRMAVGCGAAQMKRPSSALRQGLAVDSASNCAGAAGPADRTRALGWSQVPQ